MAGQEDSLDQAAREDCEVWYEWMVANLLYTRPAVRAYDLVVHGHDDAGQCVVGGPGE